MSVPHHSEAEFQAQQRFISEMLQRSKPNFPQGKISDNDLGELSYAVAVDFTRNVVIIRYAKPIDWIGLDAKSCRDLSKLLCEKATQLELGPEPTKLHGYT